MVRPIALHYAHCTDEPCDDLLQVGLLGLIRAAELYRPERQVPFAAFARPHVRGAILHYLRDVAPTIRLPRRRAELQERLSRLEREEMAAGPLAGRSDPDGLRRRLGLTAPQWQRLQCERSLRRPCRLQPEHLEGLAAEDDGPRPDETATDPAGALLALLEPRQRRVVRQVVLAGWSYRRLGAEMGVSPMTVQRLLRRGLERLRCELGPERLSSPPRPGRGASAAPAC
jgi:RNA polymerase sigma-B factor